MVAIEWEGVVGPRDVCYCQSTEDKDRRGDAVTNFSLTRLGLEAAAQTGTPV